MINLKFRDHVICVLKIWNENVRLIKLIRPDLSTFYFFSFGLVEVSLLHL